MFGLKPVLALLALLIVATPSAALAKRVALVIGNDAYQTVTPLENPKRDAAAIAEVFESLGFSVVLGTDLDLRDVALKLAEFEAALEDAEVAAFYYAGHAIQLEGQNFLIPTDASLENKFLFQAESIALSDVTRIMSDRAAVSLVFLDACRNNPFLTRVRAALPKSRSATLSRGLARVSTPNQESMIMFATTANNVASDGEGEHSPFAQALMTHLAAPDTEISVAMKRVTRDVREATGGQQSPELQQSMTVELYLNLSATIGLRIPEREPVEEQGELTPDEARLMLTDLWRRGNIASQLGNDDNYLDVADEALKLAGKVFGEDSEEYGQANTFLVGALNRLGRLEDAVYAAREAIRVYSITDGPDSWRVAHDRSNLALRLKRLGRDEEAEAEWQESISIFGSIELTRRQIFDYGIALNEYARFLFEQDRPEEALIVSRRSLAELDRTDTKSPPHSAPVFLNAAHIERRIGSCDTAAELYAKAVQTYHWAGFAETQVDYAEALKWAAEPCPEDQASGSGYPSPERAVACVQKQLAALGYRPGQADGALGANTKRASEDYRRYMKSQYPGWNQQVLRIDNSEHWCRQLASANQSGREAYQEYLQHFGANGMIVTQVLMDAEMRVGEHHPVRIAFANLGDAAGDIQRVCFDWNLGSVGPQCTRDGLSLGFGSLTVDVTPPRAGTLNVNAFIEYASGGRTWVTNMYTNRVTVK